METSQHDYRQELRQRWNELQTLRDEIRVRLHLAGMDARDRWNRLEPKVERFGHRIEEVTEDAVDELRKTGKDLRSRLRDLREKL